MFPGGFAGDVKPCWVSQLQRVCATSVTTNQAECRGFALQSILALFSYEVSC